MARETQKSSDANRRGRLSRARGAIGRTARKVTTELQRKPTATMESQPPAAAPHAKSRPQGGTARPRRLQTDVPMEAIANAYTPTQTSLKGPFRANGDDQQRDQEMAGGYADDRWNDEDRFTNKSGDPRIGTHGRSYEPGENRNGRNEGER